MISPLNSFVQGLGKVKEMSKIAFYIAFIAPAASWIWARRDIDGGGVKINGQAVAPKSYNIDPSELKVGDTLSVGKRKGFKLI